MFYILFGIIALYILFLIIGSLVIFADSLIGAFRGGKRFLSTEDAAVDPDVIREDPQQVRRVSEDAAVDPDVARRGLDRIREQTDGVLRRLDKLTPAGDDLDDEEDDDDEDRWDDEELDDDEDDWPFTKS